jgi:hypothetical protein
MQKVVLTPGDALRGSVIAHLVGAVEGKKGMLTLSPMQISLYKLIGRQRKKGVRLRQ